MTELKKSTDILVIGGGQAGLAMGYFLQSKGCQFQILERNRRIGDSWRRRYDSLKLFSTREFSSLPGLPLPGDKNGFASKDEIAGYLEEYASHVGLPVVCGTGVKSLQRVGDGFRSQTENGFEVTSRAVIIATGAFQIPAIPALAKDLAPSVSQYSPDTYQNPSQIQVGTVLVVGDGATGRQIALELSSTNRVFLARGRMRSVSPAFILGKSNFWWMEKLGLSRTPYTSPLGHWFMNRDPFPGLQLTLFNLRRRGIRVVKRLTGVEGSTVTFANGVTADVTSVIWATGYHDDSRWVSIPEVKGPKGNYIERRGLTAVPNLYFIGRSWQWTRGSALLFGVARDAEYLMPPILAGLETGAKEHRGLRSEEKGEYPARRIRYST
jgi:putative flavoprotein involved in K+ transport